MHYGRRVGYVALTVMLALSFPLTSATASNHNTASSCRSHRPARWHPAIGHAVKGGNLRVVGIQYDQRIADVTSYQSYRQTMVCLVREFVLPHRAKHHPTIAVFNEDIGLETLAIGSRGAVVREEDGTPVGGASTGGEPVSAAAALVQLNAAYAPQIAADQAALGTIDPRREVFVGETDTIVRSFMATFSYIARRFHIYVVASATMAPYKATSNAAQVKVFGDPSLKSLTTAYVATSSNVYNTTYLWGPNNVHPKAAMGKQNVLFTNRKVPLTSFESSILGVVDGPTTGKAGIRNARGYVVAGHRLGFATSLPAFAYGYRLGQKPRYAHPCQHIADAYMPCMSHLGVDTVIQAEANDGEWAANGGDGYWQPLAWMNSSYRAVTDPTVKFRYAINPMMVGNLLDLPFDGQSSIVARRGVTRRAIGNRSGGRRYIGDRTLHPKQGDPKFAKRLAGNKPQFVALAPWVMQGTRANLAKESARLAPGSGSTQESDYLETAVWTDLLPRHRAQ